MASRIITDVHENIELCIEELKRMCRSGEVKEAKAEYERAKQCINIVYPEVKFPDFPGAGA